MLQLDCIGISFFDKGRDRGGTDRLVSWWVAWTNSFVRAKDLI